MFNEIFDCKMPKFSRAHYRQNGIGFRYAGENSFYNNGAALVNHVFTAPAPAPGQNLNTPREMYVTAVDVPGAGGANEGQYRDHAGVVVIWGNGELVRW